MLCKFEERSRENKGQFVPFVNERDFMGCLLSEEQMKGGNRSGREVDHWNYLQNLKKSTKEYFFDKQFKKMSEKLQRIKTEMQHKDYDFDKEIQKCFISLEKFKANARVRTESSFYVELFDSLNRKVQALKDRIHRRDTKVDQQNLAKVTKPQKTVEINRQLFKGKGERSLLMTDFTNCGLKYIKYVDKIKKDPWKKWYVKEEVELFPGKIVKITRLQKSIY